MKTLTRNFLVCSVLLMHIILVSAKYIEKYIMLDSPNKSCDIDGQGYKDGEIVTVSPCHMIFCSNGKIQRTSFVDERFGCPHIEIIRKDGKCTDKTEEILDSNFVWTYSDCVVEACIYGKYNVYKHKYCGKDVKLIDTEEAVDNFRPPVTK